MKMNYPSKAYIYPNNNSHINKNQQEGYQNGSNIRQDINIRQHIPQSNNLYNYRVNPQTYDNRTQYITSSIENTFEQIRNIQNQLPSSYSNYNNSSNSVINSLKFNKYQVPRITQMPEQEYSVQTIQEIMQNSQDNRQSTHLQGQKSINFNNYSQQKVQNSQNNQHSQNNQNNQNILLGRSKFSPYYQLDLQIQEDKIHCVICNQTYLAHQQESHLIRHKNKNKVKNLTQSYNLHQVHQIGSIEKPEQSISQIKVINNSTISKPIIIPQQFQVKQQVRAEKLKQQQVKKVQKKQQKQISTQYEQIKEMPKQHGKCVQIKKKNYKEIAEQKLSNTDKQSSSKLSEKKYAQTQKIYSQSQVNQSQDSFIVLEKKQYINRNQSSHLNYGGAKNIFIQKDQINQSSSKLSSKQIHKSKIQKMQKNNDQKNKANVKSGFVNQKIKQKLQNSKSLKRVVQQQKVFQKEQKSQKRISEKNYVIESHKKSNNVFKQQQQSSIKINADLIQANQWLSNKKQQKQHRTKIFVKNEYNKNDQTQFSLQNNNKVTVHKSHNFEKIKKPEILSQSNFSECQTQLDFKQQRQSLQLIIIDEKYQRSEKPYQIHSRQINKSLLAQNIGIKVSSTAFNKQKPSQMKKNMKDSQFQYQQKSLSNHATVSVVVNHKQNLKEIQRQNYIHVKSNFKEKSEIINSRSEISNVKNQSHLKQKQILKQPSSSSRRQKNAKNLLAQDQK